MKVIFFDTPWDIVSFQQGASRSGRRLYDGRIVPGAVHIVQGSNGRQTRKEPLTNYQIRAGRDAMQAFVESLRLSAESPSSSKPPPCFRSVQYGFLCQDSRECLLYTDGSLPCSSCLSQQASVNTVLPEFWTPPRAIPPPPPHPSVVLDHRQGQQRALESEVRVRIFFNPSFDMLYIVLTSRLLSSLAKVSY